MYYTKPVWMVQFYEDSCLVKQRFVMADDQSVQVCRCIAPLSELHPHGGIFAAKQKCCHCPVFVLIAHAGCCHSVSVIVWYKPVQSNLAVRVTFCQRYVPGWVKRLMLTLDLDWESGRQRCAYSSGL